MFTATANNFGGPSCHMIIGELLFHVGPSPNQIRQMASGDTSAPSDLPHLEEAGLLPLGNWTLADALVLALGYVSAYEGQDLPGYEGQDPRALEPTRYWRWGGAGGSAANFRLLLPVEPLPPPRSGPRAPAHLRAIASEVAWELQAIVRDLQRRCGVLVPLVFLIASAHIHWYVGAALTRSAAASLSQSPCGSLHLRFPYGGQRRFQVTL
eukprot:GHVT01079848.1.p1 GENE.GHVT01079848.1~~GHVT01079848.1.p1  ORF type:complete len:210 (+),score=28.85 GHVT01079848.1:439-1068(+)